MAKTRVAMRAVHEILRLDHECGRSQREMALRARCRWEGQLDPRVGEGGRPGVATALAGLDEAELEERLYGRPAGPHRSERRAALDFAGMRKELAAAVAGGPAAAWRGVRLLAGMQDSTIAGVENGTPRSR